jgi:O-succinylbenzoate synthase
LLKGQAMAAKKGAQMHKEQTKIDHAVSAQGTEIASIECFPVRLPLRKPLIMSTYRIDDGPVLFLRIRAANGAEGWGEAAANPIMSGETLQGMQAVIDNYMKPRTARAFGAESEGAPSGNPRWPTWQFGSTYGN